ncbi:MAG: Beta-galactosidase C-terminal domain, partial [Actinomycetota bacterium]|nr:Beta-galactosidase C-terminal domain [Actinomycetota bacterium]
AGLPVREQTDVNAEAVTRSNDDTDYTFLLNHGAEPLAFEVPAPGVDLITGDHVAGVVELPGYGVAVVAAPRATEIPFITLTTPTAKEQA